MSKPLLQILFSVALVVTSGCMNGDRRRIAPVKGKVTYNGKPVPHGTVVYIPTSGPAAYGEISKQGDYRLSTYTNAGGDGAVIGTHQVGIVALEDTSGALPEQRSGTPGPIVPQKYLSHTTSGLSVEVKDEPNEFDFNLTDK